MDEIKLSIVIATRGREYYCVKSIKTMLSFIDNNTEITVSDNSTTSIVKDYINELNDKRVKYVSCEGILTMSENYNSAISLANGKYICMIGDDDIVLPSIYEVLRYAADNDVDCVTQKKVINYIWPDSNNSGTLYLPFFSGEYELINPVGRNINYIKNGCCTNPRDYKLPALYHGMVKKEVLDRIKAEKGKIISGISPDSYMAVVLSLYVKKQVEADVPFSIGGACLSSATVSNIHGKHCGELTDSVQYSTNIKNGYVWNHKIPTYYSVQTIWADSALHAINDIKTESFFSIEKLTARAVTENRRIAKDIIRRTAIFVKTNGVRISWSKTHLFVFLYLLRKIINKMLSIFITKNKIIVIDSVGEINSLLDPKYGLA